MTMTELDAPAADPRSTWRDPGFAFGAAFNFVNQRERLAWPFGQMMWGTDTRLIYRRMVEVIGEAPEGAAILDVPCGGGTAFRGLRANRAVRYVAADISPAMLNRARKNAASRGLGQIEFVEADVVSLPFEDSTFDLCVCFNSLHNFPRPAVAVAEMARCLKPGGLFVADCAVLGAGKRFDALFRLFQRASIFGPGGTAEDLKRWLLASELANVELQHSGAVSHALARRPG